MKILITLSPLLLLFFLSTPQFVNAQGLLEENLKVWVNAGFLNPTIKKLNLNNPELIYTHEVPLDIVLFRNSQWTKEQLLKRYLYAAHIFSSCENIKINFNPVRLISLDSPSGIFEFRHGTRHEESTERIAERIPNKKRLTMIHIQTLLAPYHATSSPLFMFGENHPRLYKQWVAYRSAWDKKPPITELEYSVEAHELAHVLLNDGIHTLKKSDVMSLKEGVKTLSKKQCSKITHHPEVFKL